MVCFYVIYRYVFSAWRSIRTVEINQYDLTMASHYDIAMGNGVNLFYYVFSALYLIVLFYYG